MMRGAAAKRLFVLALGIVSVGSLGCRAARKPPCEDRVATMRARLEPLARDVRLRARMLPVALPPGSGALTEPEVVVSISATEIAWNRERIAELPRGPLAPADGPAALRGRLREHRPRSIALAIDEQAPWAAIVDTLEAAAQAGVSVELIVAGPPGLSPDELPGKVPDMQTVERQIGECRQAALVFESLADASVDHDPTEQLLVELPIAAQACDCELDVERLTDSLRYLLTPTTTLHVVALEPAVPTAKSIRHDPSTRWSEVAAEVLAAAPQVELELALAEPPPPEPEPEPEPAQRRAD